MKLKYIGKPGPFVDMQSRSKWMPGDVREVDDHMVSSRLVGSGLFVIQKDQEMPSENKMTAPLRRKRDDA